MKQLKSVKLIILLGCALTFSGTLYAQTKKSSNNQNQLTDFKKGTKMSAQTLEKNKEAIRNLYEGILNQGKMELLNQIISEDYTGIRGEKGAAGFAETVNSIRAAFPDIKWTVEDLIAEGDKVVIRWSWTGTNTSSFRGFPPSQKKVSDNAIAIYQFSGDKVIKAWIQSDRLGFLQQIGVIPQDLVTPPSQKGK